MQRIGILSVVVASILAFGGILAQADEDTPAQAAARAALQQQMNQMDTEQAPGSTNSMTAPAVVSPTPPPATTSPTPPPVSAPTPQFSTNVPVTAEEQSAMAPAGMSQTNQPAMAEMSARTNLPAITAPPPSVLTTNETEQYPVNPPMAPLPPPQSETPTMAPTVMTPTHPVAVPPSGSSINQWPAAAQPTLGAPQVPTAPLVNGTGPNIGNEPKVTNSEPSFSTITAPPLPISQQQQADLQSLLSQYMANQITPAQYQEERAKILAQP